MGSVLTFRDMTEKQQAAEALEASELRFSGFMQHLPGLAWIKDLQGRYIYANDAAEKAFRKSRAELYGKTDEEVFDPETAKQFRENDHKALDSRTGIQVIETLTDDCGAFRHSIVSKFPIPGATEAAMLVGGMAIDVTERMQAEQELRRHKERLELAQHAGRIGTFEWNVLTDDVELSAGEEELLGLRVGSFAGQLADWLQAVHPDDRERTMADCRRAVAERTPLDAEFRIIRPDGQIRWIAAQGSVKCDELGQAVRMVGVNVDVTERRQAEIALRDSDRRKDEFLAILAARTAKPAGSFAKRIGGAPAERLGESGRSKHSGYDGSSVDPYGSADRRLVGRFPHQPK